MEQKLSRLSPGRSGIVVQLEDGELYGRLQDLGFTPGTEVTLERISPLGDPLAFRVRGALIALRRIDASSVTVSVSRGEKEGGQ